MAAITAIRTAQEKPFFDVAKARTEAITKVKGY